MLLDRCLLSEHNVIVISLFAWRVSLQAYEKKKGIADDPMYRAERPWRIVSSCDEQIVTAENASDGNKVMYYFMGYVDSTHYIAIDLNKSTSRLLEIIVEKRNHGFQLCLSFTSLLRAQSAFRSVLPNHPMFSLIKKRWINKCLRRIHNFFATTSFFI